MKRGVVLAVTGLLLLALNSTARALSYTDYYLMLGVSDASPTNHFVIAPFDTTFGTLNAVTVYAEVNVDGYAAGETSDYADATLTATFGNAIGPIPELGWSSGVFATFTDTAQLPWGSISNSANNWDLATITAGFGRFAGTTSFPVDLTLSIPVVSADPLVTSYWTSSTGNGSLLVTYDYTPGSVSVPEPLTLAFLGLGLIGIPFARRKFKN